MELNKITERDLEGKGVLGQPEIPGLSANEMQEKVEEIVRSVAIAKINEIIDYLKEHGATKNDLEEIVVAAGAVTSVFGRRGAVLPQEGDYTPEMIGAAKEKHSEEHFFGGKDPIDPEKIGAAKEEHNHGNIGNTNGKIVVTGIGGVLEAKDKNEIGFVTNPVLVATSGAVSVTVENNREYEYTGVSALNLVGADAECHGTVVFGNNAPAISVTGFKANGGDDISKAAANETWEFSCYKKMIIWKNWGVI